MNINKTLEQAPNEIATRAVKAEDSRLLWKEEELRLKQLEAKTHLTIKANKPDATQTDIKAEVESNEEVYKKKCDVLIFESEYKKEMIELDKWVNAFNSARKLANVKIEEMRSLHQTVGGN